MIVGWAGDRLMLAYQEFAARYASLTRSTFSSTFNGASHNVGALLNEDTTLI